MKRILGLLIVAALVTSCVSKKKYVQLEQDLIDTKGELQQTTLEKEELETKMAAIEKRVEIYNANINSLQADNATLQASNDQKMDFLDDNSAVMSANMKANLDATLAQLPAEELEGAKTLKDSMNIAIAHNLKKSISESNMENDGDINVGIDHDNRQLCGHHQTHWVESTRTDVHQCVDILRYVLGC